MEVYLFLSYSRQRYNRMIRLLNNKTLRGYDGLDGVNRFGCSSSETFNFSKFFALNVLNCMSLIRNDKNLPFSNSFIPQRAQQLIKITLCMRVYVPV